MSVIRNVSACKVKPLFILAYCKENEVPCKGVQINRYLNTNVSGSSLLRKSILWGCKVKIWYWIHEKMNYDNDMSWCFHRIIKVWMSVYSFTRQPGLWTPTLQSSKKKVWAFQMKIVKLILPCVIIQFHSFFSQQ